MAPVKSEPEAQPSEPLASASSSEESGEDSAKHDDGEEWADEDEEEDGGVPISDTAAGPLEGRSPGSDSSVAPVKQRKKRPARAPIFRTKKDYERYDRPDMYIDPLFSYMGMHLAPEPPACNSQAESRSTIPAFALPKHCRVLKMSVEGGIMATGAELFGTLQKQILTSSNKKGELPSAMTLKNQTYSLEYATPDGDEINFGSHSQDARCIGDQLIGTVFIGFPEDPNNHPAPFDPSVDNWKTEWSFRSWHRPKPQGVLKMRASVKVLPRPASQMSAQASAGGQSAAAEHSACKSESLEEVQVGTSGSATV